MKSKAIYRITALIMAFLMFFTSIGFSINVHYCKGELKSVSLIGEAESCHDSKKICPHHAKIQKEKEDTSDCCSNENVQIDDLDTDFNLVGNADFTDIQIKVITAFVYAYGNLSVQTDSSISYFKWHDRIPQRDIYVLLERFLI